LDQGVIGMAKSGLLLHVIISGEREAIGFTLSTVMEGYFASAILFGVLWLSTIPD